MTHTRQSPPPTPAPAQPLRDCVACSRRNADPSSVMAAMHRRCYGNLPEITRRLFEHGGLSAARVVEISRERNASVRALGGGPQRG